MIDPEFAALLARVRQGDPQAAEEFYDSYKDIVLRSLRYRLQEYAQRHGLRDPEDYLQSTLGAFWEALHEDPDFLARFLKREQVVAWMLKVAQNKINKDARRPCNRHQRVALEEVPQDKLVSRQPTAEQLAYAKELLAALEDVFPDYRDAVQMRLAGYTLEQISDHFRKNRRFLERMFAKLRIEPRQ
jgi:DNA-directed RNA polymerase specialized sigma24 family protein